MALTKYIQATQSLLNDPAAQRFSVASLTTFINTGRSQLALEGECVRFNYGADGVFLTGAFTSGSPTVTGVAVPTLDTITSWNAAGLAIPQGATVLSSTTTTITFSANATASGGLSFLIGPPNSTSTQREFYARPTNVCLSRGIKDAIGVRGVAINYGGFGSNLYTLRQRDWTWFQAFLRSYPSLLGNPVYWSPYQNNLFLRPIPAAVYPMQWDCQCSVVDLVDDTTPEAIPYSFTDAIPYFAAYLALMSAQRKDDAQNMMTIYERFTKVGRRNVQSTFVPDIYESV